MATKQKCSACGKSCRRTLNMCPTCYPPQRLIGSTWKDSKGRTWEVLSMVNPGRYQIGVMAAGPSGGRIAVRIGEMYAAAIRANIAKAEPA